MSGRGDGAALDEEAAVHGLQLVGVGEPGGGVGADVRPGQQGAHQRQQQAERAAGVRLVDAQRSGAPVFAAVASERALNTKEVGGVKCWQWWTSLPNAEVSLLRRTT